MISREEEIFNQGPANIPTARKASGYSNKRIIREGIYPSDAAPMANLSCQGCRADLKDISSTIGVVERRTADFGRYAVLGTFYDAAI